MKSKPLTRSKKQPWELPLHELVPHIYFGRDKHETATDEREKKRA